jgi:hypothetical protein
MFDQIALSIGRVLYFQACADCSMLRRVYEMFDDQSRARRRMRA